MYPTEKAYALLYLGHYDEAWASLQREIADEAHQFGRMTKDLCTGRFFLELMAYEKASAVLESALDQASRLHRWRFAFGARLLLATAIIRAGHFEPTTLSRVTQDVLNIVESPSAEPSQTVTAAQVMAELLLSEGRLDEALRRAEASARHADQIGFKPLYVSAVVLQLRILLHLNRPMEVVVLADGVLAVVEAMSYRPMLWRIRAAKAQALAMLGDGASAAEEFRTAAAVIRDLAETIPDEELRSGFLARASIMTGANDNPASKRD